VKDEYYHHKDKSHKPKDKDRDKEKEKDREKEKDKEKEKVEDLVPKRQVFAQILRQQMEVHKGTRKI
jgi:hypothetical protein